MRTRNAGRHGLHITTDGRIFGPKGQRKLQDQGNGYLGITYRDLTGKMRVLYLHRALAENYVKRPPGTDCVNHIDGNKHNNNLENLEWVSKADDIRHAYAIGLISRDKGYHERDPVTGRFVG